MFSGDGRNTVLEVPLIVVLWEQVNFGGTKRLFVRDEPNLADGWTKGAICQAGAKFNKKASAVGVHPGPDYDSWKARNGGQEPTVFLWSEVDFGQNPSSFLLQLQTGGYPDLSVYGFNGVASSVQFNDAGTDTFNLKPPAFPVARIAPIPEVLRLHTAGFLQASGGNCGEADNVMTLVESSVSIAGEYGDAFAGSVSWVEVLMGPDWKPGNSITVFNGTNFEANSSDSRTYNAPSDAKLDADGFNDVLSSVRINPPPPPPAPSVTIIGDSEIDLDPIDLRDDPTVVLNYHIFPVLLQDPLNIAWSSRSRQVQFADSTAQATDVTFTLRKGAQAGAHFSFELDVKITDARGIQVSDSLTVTFNVKPLQL